MKQNRRTMTRSNGNRPIRRPRGWRPFLEQLEDRTVPSTFTVNTLADTIDANLGDGLARDSAGNTSLRAAIMEANALNGPDTIQLMPGTHTLSRSGRGENLAVNGDLDVTDSAGLTIQGAVTAASEIDANGIDRVFQLFTNARLRLVGVTVQGGSETTGAGFANQGNLTLEDSLVRNNTATLRGGGVDNNAGVLTVLRTTFLSNVASDSASNGIGGAINNGGGDMTIQESQFTSNVAGATGGAINDRSGDIAITKSTFTSNRAEAVTGSGGAVATDLTILTITDSTFTSNRAAKGGAIHGRGEVTITGSLLRANEATVQSSQGLFGGALFNENFMKVVNSTIVDNVAGSSTYPFFGYGGAIDNRGSFQLIHATVTGNSASDGGGIRHSGTGVFTIVNSIVAENTTTAAGNRLDVWGAFNSLGGNFLGYAGGGTGWLSTDQTSFGVQSPQLGPLQDNGGPTLTRASLTGSPVRDRGVIPTGLTLPSTDQRGLSRNSGTTVDVGAYEFQVTSNTAPVANSDSYTLAEDTPLTVNAPGLLANDTDADGNALVAIFVPAPVTLPAHGTLTLNANGSFTYTPHANYNGNDFFFYRANDGQANSNIAQVSLTITPVNDTPVANNNSYTTNEDTTLNVAAPGVLANDTDVDFSGLSAILVNGPAHGSLTLSANGSFSYTPSAHFNGSDSFTYKANDGSVDSNVATVTINVQPVNDAPAATGDSPSTNEDTTLNVAAPGVLGNDTDVDGHTLTAVLVSGPAHGSLTLNPNGSFSYTPSANYNGADSFTYKANDGSADSNVATVTINVAAVNDAPLATGESYSTNEDTTLNVAAPGVLGNDSDVEGNALSAILVSGPANGTLTLNANGSFSYTPAAHFNGSDSFTYKANDGSADSNVATVAINVQAVNDAPVARNDVYLTSQGVLLNVPAAGVLGNDSDVDSTTLAAVLVSAPSNGSLTLSANGSFSYVSNAAFSGADSFRYRVNDGASDSNTATVTLRVAASPSTIGKITGGGSFDVGMRRVSINVKSKEHQGALSFSGGLSFEDRQRGISFASTAISSFRLEEGRGVISGMGSMNGRAGYSFTIIIDEDAGHERTGDWIQMLISGPAAFLYDSIDWASAAGALESGNVQLHRDA